MFTLSCMQQFRLSFLQPLKPVFPNYICFLSVLSVIGFEDRFPLGKCTAWPLSLSSCYTSCMQKDLMFVQNALLTSLEYPLHLWYHHFPLSVSALHLPVPSVSFLLFLSSLLFLAPCDMHMSQEQLTEMSKCPHKWPTNLDYLLIPSIWSMFPYLWQLSLDRSDEIQRLNLCMKY